MNIMIFNMSILTRDVRNEYKWKNNVFDGIQTNEAAAKLFISTLEEKGESLDKIIYTASKEVCQWERNVEGKEYPSTEAYFKYAISRYCAENHYHLPKLVRASANKTDIIPKKLIREIEKEEAPVIFIDTTGGKRDDSDRLQLFARFLIYKGVTIEMSVYSDQKYGIKNADMNELLEILDGISQFTATGQSDLLKNALKGEMRLEPLLGYMDRFTQSLQLCQTEELDKILSDMDDELINVEKNVRTKSSRLQIFIQFIPLIREKFFVQSDNERIDYISIVKWCIKNALIQQALTIYVECIPFYLLDHDVIKYEKGRKYSKSKIDAANFLYNDIYGLKDRKTVEDIINFINDERVFEKGNYIKALQQNEKTAVLLDKLASYIEYDKRKFNIAAFKKEQHLDNIPESLFRNGKHVGLKIFLEYFFRNGKLQKEMLNSCSIRQKRLDTIRELSEVPYISFNEKVSIKQLQEVLYDYIYVKAIRNQINHASENENIRDSEKEFFIELGYEGIREFNLKNIKSDISRAVSRLEEIRRRLS